MKYSIKTTDEMVRASTTMQASNKSLQDICRKINRMEFGKAKSFMTKVTRHEASIGGKFHDKAAEGLLEFMGGLENNARQEKAEPSGMKLMISVHQGPKMMRGRRRRRHGTLMKNTHVQAVLMPAKKERENKAEAKEKKEGEKKA